MNEKRILFITICVDAFLAILSPVKSYSQEIKQVFGEEEGSVVEMLEIEEDQFESIAEDLQDIFHDPRTNINSLNVSELSRFFTLEEINLIRLHMSRFGPFQSVWELQAVKGLSSERIRNSLPFIKCGELRERSTRSTEVLVLGAVTNNNFQSPSHSFRIRGVTEGGVHYHLTMDQDAGEHFTFSERQPGYDQVSAGIAFNLTQYPQIRIIAGDYRAIYGQGLTLGQGFGLRKSIDLNMMVRGEDRLALHRSVSETGYMRGFALEGQTGKVHWNALISRRYENATIHFDPDGHEYFRSFSVSPNEPGNNRRKTVLLKEIALRVKKGGDRFEVGMTSYYRQTDKPQWVEKGNKQMVPVHSVMRTGIDWSAVLGAFYFFGEVVRSGERRIAFISGLLKSIGPATDLSLIGRNYSFDGVVYNRSGVSSGSGVNNENGIILVLNHKFKDGFRLKLLTDFYNKPFPQGLSSGPVRGTECMMQIVKKWNRITHAYFMVGEKHKTVFVRTGDHFKHIKNQRLFSYRLHVEHHLTQAVRTRFRVMGAYDHSARGVWSTLVYSDFRYKRIGGPFSISARWSVFRVPEYTLRLYTYENDVMYNHQIPSFGFSGSRIYVVWSWEFKRNFRWQLKSGLSGRETDELWTADLRMLLRWKW